MNQLSKILFNLSVNERPNLNLALHDVWPKNAFRKALLDLLVLDHFHSRNYNAGPGSLEIDFLNCGLVAHRRGIRS